MKDLKLVYAVLINMDRLPADVHLFTSYELAKQSIELSYSNKPNAVISYEPRGTSVTVLENNLFIGVIERTEVYNRIEHL